MAAQMRWPELPFTSKHSSAIPSEAFNNALARLSNVHGEEIAQLQNQIAWLQDGRGQHHEGNLLAFREADASTNPVVAGHAQAPVDAVAFVEAPIKMFPTNMTMRPTGGEVANFHACEPVDNGGCVEDTRQDLASTSFASVFPDPRPVETLGTTELRNSTNSMQTADVLDPRRMSMNSNVLRASIAEASMNSTVLRASIAEASMNSTVLRSSIAERKSVRASMASGNSQTSVRLKPVVGAPTMNQLTINPVTTAVSAIDQRSMAKLNTHTATSSSTTKTNNHKRGSFEGKHDLLKEAYNNAAGRVLSSNDELKDHVALARQRAKEMNRLSAKIHPSASRKALVIRASAAVLQTARTSSSREESNAFNRTIDSLGFDVLCGIVIVFNSVLIGHNVNAFATTGNSQEENKYLGHACSIFFFLEMILRIINQKTKYFTSEHRNWNLFDTFLVMMSVLDFLMTDILHAGTENQHFASVKTIKMLRIIRVFRIFRFFHELGTLALMIMDSMSSLMWALLMLIIIIYVFAILFTQFAADFLFNPSSYDYEDVDRLSGEVNRFFGTLPQTIYTLFQAMLNGISWGVLTDSLLGIGVIPVALFVFYIAFAILAVLNIITGVFVENAVETARSQREFLVQHEMELRRAYVGEMRELFSKIDVDGSGTVSLDEFLRYLIDPCMVYYLQALGLDPHDVEKLFLLLDEDQSGDVRVDEFLDGCLRLKGAARSIDVHYLLHEIAKIKRRIAGNFDLLLGILGVKNLQSELGLKNSMDSSLPSLSEKSYEGEL